MITINIHVHENYVQTSVRFYHSPLCYTEYGTGDVTAPAKILDAENTAQMKELFEPTSTFDEIPYPDVWQSKALDGFDGVFDVSICVSETEDSPIEFNVEEARHIDKTRGGKSIKSPFQTAVKMAMLKGLFGAVSERDVSKIQTLLLGLRAAAGSDN